MSEQEKQESLEVRLRKWLRHGGQRQLRRTQVGELYEIEWPDKLDENAWPKKVRSSAAGMQTIIPPMRDPRLDLSSKQRAVGIFLGAAAEEMGRTAGGIDLALARVDVSRKPSGSTFSERQADMVSIVRASFTFLEERPRVIYKPGKTHSARKVGRHVPVPILDLVHLTCVQNFSLSTVAVFYDWTSERGGKMVVPDRQRKRLSSALKATLEGLGEHWREQGIFPPSDLTSVEAD